MNQLIRWHALRMAAIACFLSWAGIAWAQEYPVKQVRVVLPFPAGGGSDIIARVVAQKLTGSLGQPVVVDNRAGASGNIAGESQLAFIVMPVASVQIKAGKLRGLGVAAPTRSSAAPEVPTMEEAGVKDNLAIQWNGYFAPARTPPAVIDRLHREVAKAVHLPDVKQRFEAEGATPSGSSPGEFAAFYRTEAAKWADVAKRSGTKLD